MGTDSALLLDTCAVIWFSLRAPIREAARKTVADLKAANGSIGVSVMSAWELGMLVSRGRIPSTKPPERWFMEFLETPGVVLENVTPRILIAASYLPQPLHNDPVDRILIATARERDLTIVTRDRAILAYGEAGHVRVLPC